MCRAADAPAWAWPVWSRAAASAPSPSGYGTGAAGLIEAEVVTADGQIRVVNARRSPDLFWALKGGGGGSFGVVTRLTLLTHEAPRRGGGFEVTIKAADDTAFRRLIDVFLDVCRTSLCSPHWGEQVAINGDNTLKVTMVTTDLEDAEAVAAWRPLTEQVAASDDAWRFIKLPDAGNSPFRDWWDAAGRRARNSKSMRYDNRPGVPPIQAWWDGDSEQVSAFMHGYDSVWLPRALLTGAGKARLTEALYAASRRHAVLLHFNKGLSGAPPEALARSRATCTNPDVLDAFALAIVAGGGPPAFYDKIGFTPDLTRARKEASDIRAAMTELRKAAPTAGSYISETDFFDANWRRDFWGDHYPRLRAIKAKYDPSGLFFVHHGVGSEDWSADGFTRTA